ncbi:MAG: citrate synthase, partial [Methylobacteriaceae bacterium]|nr:citrate synthase [Methylobacteriaceae bacterium]
MAWLTASQALDILGVLPQTLYANVSRGKIRAKPDPKESHRSLYHSEDVERMAGRNAGKRRAAGKPAHNPAGSVAPDSGCPPSEAPAPAVSCVWGGRLWYRGRDAVELADTASLEQTAALLWNTEPPVFLVNPERDYSPAPGETGMLAAFHLLSRRAVRDLPFSGRSRVLWIREAIELVGDLIEVFTGSPI